MRSSHELVPSLCLFAACFSAVRCISDTPRCSVLRCVAVCCSVLRLRCISNTPRYSMLRCVAAGCSVLQSRCVSDTPRCSVLRCVAVYRGVVQLRCICNTLRPLQQMDGISNKSTRRESTVGRVRCNFSTVRNILYKMALGLQLTFDTRGGQILYSSFTQYISSSQFYIVA